MHRTLVAVSQLAKQGTLMFTGSQFWYTNRMAPPTEAEVIAKGETVNGVYLFEEPDEASAATAIRSRARNSFNVPRKLLSLHAIFNHANVGRVKHMRSLLPKQLPLCTSLCASKCESCFKGKATRAPHLTRDKKGVVLQLINLDTVGPFPASRDGNKYCCAIVDDSSGYVEPAIRKTKGGVAPFIVRKLRVLQHATKMHVDTIQTDGAGELCKVVVKQWAEAQGTTTKTTFPTHSSANGLAEQTVRTLQETATTV
jgi:hypothetical protein